MPMDAETPKKPWHRKRRWRIAIASWLLLPGVYVAATGPVMYAEMVGWVPQDTYFVVFRPLYRVLFPVHGADGPLVRGLNAYALWWSGLSSQARSVQISEQYGS